MKTFFRIGMLTMAVLLASCSSNDNFLEDLSDNPYDNDTTNPPVSGQGQLEADINGSHFASIQGGVFGTIFVMNNWNGEQEAALQIIGANQASSLTLQVSGGDLYEGAVLTASDDVLLVVSYLNLQNPSESYTSIGDSDESDMTITITDLDTTNNSISGTFTGTLYNIQTNTSIALTNGVFTNVDISSSTTSGMSYNGNMTLTQDNTNYVLDTDSETGNMATLFYFNNDFESNFVISGLALNPNNDGLQNWSIKFPFTASGTLTIDGETVDLAYAVTDANNNSENFESSPSGTITITQNSSGTVSGTFEGSVQNDQGEAVTITNGTFSFQY